MSQEPVVVVRFRVDAALAKRWREAVMDSPNVEDDQSKVLRRFVRWYAGDPGAVLPERPADRVRPKDAEGEEGS